MKRNNMPKYKLKGQLRNWRGISDPAARLGMVLIVGGIVAALCLLIFAEFAEELLENELAVFDTRVTIWIHSMVSAPLTQLMKLISMAGGNWLFLGFTALGVALFLYRKQHHFWDALIVQICLWGGALFNYGLKWMFKRERPSLGRLVDAGGFSFPSGHSMVSFAFYGMLMYLVYINLPRTLPRMILVILISAFIMLVGMSRVYLGVHYPSDVAAGFAAGGVWLAVCIVALETVRHYKGKNELQ